MLRSEFLNPALESTSQGIGLPARHGAKRSKSRQGATFAISSHEAREARRRRDSGKHHLSDDLGSRDGDRDVHACGVQADHRRHRRRGRHRSRCVRGGAQRFGCWRLDVGFGRTCGLGRGAGHVEIPTAVRRRDSLRLRTPQGRRAPPALRCRRRRRCSCRHWARPFACLRRALRLRRRVRRSRHP